MPAPPGEGATPLSRPLQALRQRLADLGGCFELPRGLGAAGIGLVVAVAALDLLVLSAQVGVPGACGGLGGLNQGCPQVAVPLAGAPGATLPADSWLPGQILIQLAAWRWLANRAMSMPSSVTHTIGSQASHQRCRRIHGIDSIGEVLKKIEWGHRRG